MPSETILIAVILISGLYMAWNIGANDVANAMGTSVGSGALLLKQAVIIAAIFEFSGAFFFGSHVSDTIQTGIIDSNFFSKDPLILVYGMLAALLASGVWLQIASYYGWPVSATHSIVGAIVGFGAAVGGWQAIYWGNVGFIVSSWIISPLLGGIISYAIFTLLRNKIFYTSNPIESTKKLTPILVFLVISSLSFILIFNGLQNLNLNFIQASIISISLGILASIISYFLVRRIQPPTRSESHMIYGSEIITALDKAKKHLEKVRSACFGEMRYHVSVLVDEVEYLSQVAKKPEIVEVSKSEYAVVEKVFSYLQIITACMMAFAHGANDVANAIGPLSASITILTTRTIIANTTVPLWALALGGLGIVAGLATWGWRVIETIGKKITELTPTRGFAAEFGAATTVALASRFGLPISTTHTLVGAVIGVGLARGIEALDLAMTKEIVVSWIVTVPAGAGIAIVFFYAIEAIFR